MKIVFLFIIALIIKTSHAATDKTGSDYIFAKVTEPQAYCKFNPFKDLKTKYCGFYGEIDIPEYVNNNE